MSAERKVFHGWYIVASCFLISFMLSGFVTRASVAFSWAITEETEWSRGDFSVAMAAALLPMIFVPLLVGWLVDSIGCKKPMLVGCLLSGAGMILFAGISQLWHFALLSFFIHTGVYAATGIPIKALLLNWFKQRRGVAIGIALTGASIGFGIMGLTNSFMEESLGWRKLSVLFGVVAMLITIPLILHLIKNRPSEMGLHADGIEAIEKIPAEPTGHTLKEAYRARTFWYIAGGLFLMNIVSMLPLWPLSIHLSEQGSSTVTLNSGGGLSTGVMVFALLLGMLADRRGAAKTFVFVAYMTAVGIGLLTLAPPTWILAVFPLFQKISWAGLLVLTPLIIADCYGLSRFGIIYALLWLLGGMGTPMAGIVVSLIYDSMTDKGLDPVVSFRIVLVPHIILAFAAAYLIRKARPLADSEPSTA